MFQDAQSLREFIVWCKDQKIKKVQIDTVTIEFSDLAFIDMLTGEPLASVGNEERDTSKTMVDTLQQESDDELLFWSTKA